MTFRLSSARPIVIFASYGNDSIALIQWAYEAGLRDVCAVYSDTGWAKTDWIERVEEAEQWVRGLGFKTDRTQSIGLEALVKQRKGWPRQGMQFCTLHLKIEPAMRWLDDYDPCGIAICLVGVRREESQARKSFPSRMEFSANHGMREMWAPLAEHTTAKRDALLERAGFTPLPHRSKECFPCINDNRTDLQMLDEDTIAKVERIENELGVTSKGKPRTMFRPYRHMGATGIREIVKWANSPRGKFNPDDGTGESGCESGWCGI